VYKEYLSSIEEVIEDARNGKMFILVDAEDRENEGDLVIPAQMCTPEAVNFMAKYGRGLVCLTLTGDRAKQLNLQFMSSNNQSRNQTAFTVSIEAREGISTGISAHDRAHTVSVAIDPTKGQNDIVSPGHVFPLVAKDGGVLVRAGHTEAAVDIARLAGLYPAGVICEIMNDDGTMARLPDLVQFAQLHGLKIATIADLIAYRRRYDHFIHRAIETELESKYGGEFKMMVYLNTVEYAEHIALVKGSHACDQCLRRHSRRFGLALRSAERVDADDFGRRPGRHRSDPRYHCDCGFRSAAPQGRSARSGHAAPLARIWRRRADPSRSRRP
jgi:3,4-dihydroxy 2-butanone 4-phosphate synthase/GTP cyclohydrolase II